MNDASVNPGLLLLRRTIKIPLRIFLWKNSERIDDVNWYLILVIVDNYPRQRLAVNSTFRSFFCDWTFLCLIWESNRRAERGAYSPAEEPCGSSKTKSLWRTLSPLPRFLRTLLGITWNILPSFVTGDIAWRLPRKWPSWNCPRVSKRGAWGNSNRSWRRWTRGVGNRRWRIYRPNCPISVCWSQRGARWVGPVK